MFLARLAGAFCAAGQRRPDLVPVLLGLGLAHVSTPRIPTLAPVLLASWSLSLSLTFRLLYADPLLGFSIMVKSTLVVRASDALPLAASVDDEQVRLTDPLHPPVTSC